MVRCLNATGISRSMSFGDLFKWNGERAAGDDLQSDIRSRLEMLEAFETARLGWFWATDADHRLTYLSSGAANQAGIDPVSLSKVELSHLFKLDRSQHSDSQRSLPFLLNARNSIIRLPLELNRDGASIWWELSGRPTFDESGSFAGFRGSASDVTQERSEQLHASRLARFDPLTNLANRLHMQETLDRTLVSYRNTKRNCALFLIDLDRFKQVNDTLGHPVGDQLLSQVGSRLQRIIGEQGTIGRVGGDEFQVMLPDLDDRGTLGDLAQRCIQMLSQPYQIEGHRVLIGASIGIAIAPFDGIESAGLVSAADLALYSAKNNGRGQFRFYCSDLKNAANLRRTVEADLRDAVMRDELEMHYQPIVNAKTNRVECFESLMRWNHPDSGWISPEIFIDVAEDTGIIKELGKWALETACRDAASWPDPLSVAVNVSAIQFAQADLPKIVQHALRKAELQPERLTLEITESIFMGDAGSAETMFSRLKRLGVKLALDDFGTGYSSLSYLRNAPYDKIKIDQSFVRGATEPGNNNKAILKAIVAMADDLHMQTVAEGVEAHDELDLVREMGATHVQGYIYAKALPQRDVIARLATGSLEFEASGPPRFRAERKSMMRQVGVIHDDFRYQAILRNLSKTGARIEGLEDVPTGTEIVVDLGEGQLAVAKVRRSKRTEIGVEFETPLVSDGADGLCTRVRISPYAIEAAGKPLVPLSHASQPAKRSYKLPQFRQIRAGERG